MSTDLNWSGCSFASPLNGLAVKWGCSWGCMGATQLPASEHGAVQGQSEIHCAKGHSTELSCSRELQWFARALTLHRHTLLALQPGHLEQMREEAAPALA